MVNVGFTGSETTVRDAVAKWRKPVNSPVIAPVRLPSASRVSRWLMPWRMIRGEENYASRFIESMCQKEPQLKMAQQLSLDFYRMLKTKNKSQLNQWFSDVSQSGLIDLQRVAAGMEADATAIHEAISSRWSNGVLEGHVPPKNAETADVRSSWLRVTATTGHEPSGLNNSTQVAEDPLFTRR